jgi:hypothetical protein
MWDTVVSAYNSNPAVYFEILNEPHGYASSDWLGVVSAWLDRYPTVARGRVLVGGTGYCQDIPAVAASPVTQGCLFSVHYYGFWNSGDVSESDWYSNLAGEVGAYTSRTVLTEFGAPMNQGWNYSGSSAGNNGIASVVAFCDFAHNFRFGAIYWPGLRDEDSYSLFTRNNGNTALSLNSSSGLSVLQYAWGLTLPAVPTNLTAAPEDSSITLSWSPVAGATSYNIARASAPDGPFTVLAANFPGISFTNSGLIDGATYYFTVSATNPVGSSANCDPISATPLASLPGDVLGVLAGNQLQLTWPTDHIGWLLQVQTNSVGSNWVTLPLSAGANQFYWPIGASNGAAFFRLAHP